MHVVAIHVEYGRDRDHIKACQGVTFLTVPQKIVKHFYKNWMPSMTTVTKKANSSKSQLLSEMLDTVDTDDTDENKKDAGRMLPRCRFGRSRSCIFVLGIQMWCRV